jgi:hypothetical protein
MGTEFRDEDLPKGLVTALAEEFPEIDVAKGGECRDFELQEVVLRRARKKVSHILYVYS